jgi:hexulose-6-phosphate isomerase
MQGRLSPQVDDRIQRFPSRTWRDEFARAREAGLDRIEWIFDVEADGPNPLRTDAGIAEIRALETRTGVTVRSICADYFMSERLLTRDGRLRKRAVEELAWLLGRAAGVGVRYIVLPFVDASSLGSSPQREGLLTILQELLAVAEHHAVELHLETDLGPDDFVDVLERVSSPWVRANYDIGNSAALGYDPGKELGRLSPWLGSVHVKDRVRGGGTVPLGAGAADFPTVFRKVVEARYRGPFILQAARVAGLDEVELAKRNRRFVETHLPAACPGFLGAR